MSSCFQTCKSEFLPLFKLLPLILAGLPQPSLTPTFWCNLAIAPTSFNAHISPGQQANPGSQGSGTKGASLPKGVDDHPNRVPQQRWLATRNNVGHHDEPKAEPNANESTRVFCFEPEFHRME